MTYRELLQAGTGDLISRRALLADLREKGFLPAIVQRAIERAPTVDAVQVVRCEECRESIEIDNVLYCNYWRKNVVEDGYCHEGG